jgi:hypothetical protein
MGVLAACGQKNEVKENETKDAKEKSAITATIKRGEKANVFVYTIKNNTGKDIELNYSSGQVYDFIIDKDGKEFYHFAADQMFTQSLKKVTLKNGDELTYNLRNPKMIGLGNYTVTAWSTAKELGKVKSTAELKFDIKAN